MSARPASSVELLAGAGGLSVVFQPIMEVRGAGSVVHAVEGLVRGPRGTRLEPADLLFAFFRTRGEERALSSLCVETVLRRSAALPGVPRVCVNVAAEHAAAPGFLEELLGASDRAGVCPARVVVDVALDDRAFDQLSLGPAVAALRRYGFRVAYDEGWPFAASFPLLLDAPPDYVKLDVEVARLMRGDATQRGFVDAVVSLARSGGFRVVAEGIESAADLAAARACGIELFQGFHFLRPLEAAHPWMVSCLERVPDAWGEAHAR